MKKVLGFVMLMALFAASVFAAAPMRVQGLNWGTWTSTGFDAVADTSFLNGAVQTSDTTDAFNLANVDWGAMGYDANGTNPILRVWVQGSFVSCDSIFVRAEQSFDKFLWFGDAASETSNGYGGQNQQAFSVPFSASGTTGGVSTNPSGSGLAWAPFVRFIVRTDGNTAARSAATTVRVAYRDVRDSPSPVPQMVSRKIKWGQFSPNGWTADKDSSSLLIASPDTTQWISGVDMASGPADVAGLVTDSTQAFGNITLFFSDPSGADSAYTQVETSADGYKVNSPPLKVANVFGMLGSVVTTGPETLDGSPKTIASFNFGGNHPSIARHGDAELTPFLRFIVRPGASGEVMGGATGWITTFRVPRK